MRKGFHGPLARSKNSPPPKFIYTPPPDDGLDILHADGDILVLSKPANLLSVAGKQTQHADCLETRALKEYPTARIVHRLDRGTSGIFIMALNPASHRHLGLQFEKRKTEKTYIAEVTGIVKENEGHIDLPMRTDWYNRPKQMIDTYFGREAITDWKVISRGEKTTRMELYPKTGRSHQLRVHLQELGHPILGDSFYAPRHAVEMSNRLLLHAETLDLFHPMDGERVSFTSPCPF
ncbi:Ribosomal large subunit pseudouridine synthase A [Nymphon striatum]|nr:Ribosomal large subunit pseudouridine synthase A [Nymphon striatum]